MISLKNVSKSYLRGRMRSVALSDISLEVSRGAFICCAGPSGSGKTTLLNLLGTLDLPSSGQIVLDGHLVSDLNRKERALFRRQSLGFIFQSLNLIPVLTAAENVAYPLLLNNVSRIQCDHAVAQALALVGLEKEADVRPAELSGGQQQRVAIARAIVHKPSIILADEPTGSLDSSNGQRVMDVLQELTERYQTTCIFSSHDRDIIARAERVVLLKDGKISS